MHIKIFVIFADREWPAMLPFI